jgi:hypothetical protein
MKFFIDLEFIERGHQYPIDLISIGIVSEDNRSYYAISREFNPRNASQWVKDNVLACLPDRNAQPPTQGGSPRVWEESLAWKTRKEIATDIIEFVGESPEFWGEWSAYDHVVLCQLFGTMMDLPKGFPMFTRDIAQMADAYGISTEAFPPSLEVDGKHNALLGAQTVKMRYAWLILGYISS